MAEVIQKGRECAIINTHQRIPKGQSKMDNPENWKHRWRRTKQKYNAIYEGKLDVSPSTNNWR